MTLHHIYWCLSSAGEYETASYQFSEVSGRKGPRNSASNIPGAVEVKSFKSNTDLCFFVGKDNVYVLIRTRK